MRVFTVHSGDEKCYTTSILNDIDWEAETECLTPGEELRVVVGEISQEEYDALPEFAGY